MPRAPGRPFEFQDPNEVTPKHPTAFEDAATILNLYNQENPGSPMQNYCQSVIDWFCTYEKAHGWSGAEPESGRVNGVLLTNERVRKAFHKG